MNLFKSVRYAFWHIGLLKLATLSLGIAIGAYWPDVFLPYLSHLLILTLALGVYIAVVYFRQ